MRNAPEGRGLRRPRARGVAWLALLPYIAGAVVLLGAATAVYQFIDNRWATDAGIAEGRKRQQVETKPRIDALEKFKADAIANAQNLERARREREAKERAEKEHADAANKRDKDILQRDNARLRTDIARLRTERDRARGERLTPAKPAGSQCADGQACFERAELEAALQRHRDRVRGLLDRAAGLAQEGSEVTTDLDTAKRWAQDGARAEPPGAAPAPPGADPSAQPQR